MASDTEKKPVGELVDTLGCKVILADEELASGAIVLLAVIEENGGLALRIAISEGMQWPTVVGLLDAAHVKALGTLGTPRRDS